MMEGTTLPDWTLWRVVYIGVLFALSYLLWRLALLIKAELRIAYWHRKIPAPPLITWMSRIVGAPLFDFYPSVAHFVSVEKFFTQSLNGMNEVHSASEAGITRVRFGVKRYVNLFRWETVEPLITSLENISKSDQYDYFLPWLGTGLLTSTGGQWKRHRRLLTPAFHFKILDSFMPIMNENTAKLVNIIGQHKGEAVDIRELIGSCTLDIICETAMGVSIGAQSGNVEYSGPLEIVQNLIMTRTLNPLHQSDLVYAFTPQGRKYKANLKIIHRFIDQVIANRRDEMESLIREKKVNVHQLASDDLGVITEKKRYAFLDSLLVTHFQNKANFTEKNIKDEVNTFMFEGHDTTATSLIFTLLLVAGDERVQDKINEELSAVFGNDHSRHVTIDDCRQLRYLDLVIRESLRLYPSVPFIGRETTQDFMIKNYRIPAGCTCLIYIYLMNRDKRVFEKPEKFIPERFLPGDSPVNKLPYSYLPFSAGSRSCIGQRFAMLEMKTVLATVLRQYRLTAVTKRDQVDVEFVVLLKTHSPVCIRFEKRHQ